MDLHVSYEKYRRKPGDLQLPLYDAVIGNEISKNQRKMPHSMSAYIPKFIPGKLNPWGKINTNIYNALY